MKETTLYVLHHTHWDREWYQTFPAMQVRLRDAIRHIVTLLERGDIQSFYLDGQTCVLDDYRAVASPEEFARLETLIRQGKIEVGPWYVLADEFLCPAETMVQNLRIGTAMAERFGSWCGMGYLPDTFGHAGSMPQLLNQFGMDQAIIWRGADPRACEVDWTSRDGSRVRTLVLSTRDGYFQVGLKNRNFAPGLDEFLRFHREEKEAALLVYPDGGDHTVCSPDGMDRLRAYAQERGICVEETTMQALSRRLAACSAGETLAGELRDNRKIFVLSGVWSSRSYLKVMNQHCAARLTYELEFLSAWERDRSRSAALREHLWKQFLVNQAHDSICGCSVDDVHLDMERRYAALEGSVDAFRDSVFESMYPFVYDQPDADNLFLHVINPLPYPGRRMVEATVRLPKRLDRGCIQLLHHGVPVPLTQLARKEEEVFFHNSLAQPWYEDMAIYQVRFPMDFTGMESCCLEICPTPSAPLPESREGVGIENAYYRLEVREDSLWVLEKKTGHWHKGQHTLRSTLDAGDTYNYAPPRQDQISRSRMTATQAVIRPQEETLTVFFEMELPAGLARDRQRAGEERVCLTCQSVFTLSQGDPMIRVESTVNNTARDHKLTVDFPVGDCSVHASDGMFDWVERPVDGPFHLPVEAGREVIPGQHPSATQLAAGDLQIVHLGLHEYTVERGEEGCTCRLTLMRCVGDLSRRDLSARGGGAGPGYPTPGAQCLGSSTFTYGLIYGRENFSPVHAIALRAPVLTRQSCRRAEERRLLSLPGDVPFSAFGWENGRYYLHLFNHKSAAVSLSLTLGGESAVYQTNLAHTQCIPLAQGQEPVLSLAPGSVGCYLLDCWDGDTPKPGDESDETQ